MCTLLKYLIILISIKLITTSRILAIFPVPFRDNQLIFRPLIEELSKRGHEITVLTTDPYIFKDNHDYYNNIDQIDLSFAHNLKCLNELNNENGLSGSDMLRTVFYVMRTVAEAELKSSQIQELLRNSTEHYDAVLVDWSGPSLMNGFAYKFNAPLIGITPGGAYITSHEAMGNPNHPVTFPSILVPFSENLNLFQRITSVFFSLRYRYLYFNEELPLQHEIAKDFFGPDIPYLWDIESNADLLLVNNYQALGNSRPIGSTTIYLGGIHSTESKSLPWDLKNFFDTSHDVIYINLGETITQEFFNSYRFMKFINILENTKFDIVWNLNGIINTVNTTARLYQSSILPQEDILAHENTKLFITIGGQRDAEDAIHHSVPVLGLTFSTNIEHYLLQILKYDAGEVLNFELESNKMFVDTIQELITNNRYKKNIEKLGKLLKDQPMSSTDRAIWWIEYVIRNGGTKHLRYDPTTWFQYLLLDVFLTVIITISSLVFVCGITLIKIRRYSNSLPFEKVTRRTKAKLL